jgi:ribosomal RNA-processing protein 8
MNDDGNRRVDTEKASIDDSRNSSLLLKLNDKQHSSRKRTRDDELEQPQWSKSKKKRMRVRVTKERQQAQSAAEQIPNDINHGKDHVSSAPNIVDARSSSSKKASASKILAAKVSCGPVTGSTTSTKASANRSHTSNAVQLGSKSTSTLQKAFQERLSGSRFRLLNEELYTSTSTTAFQRFQQNPSLFEEYHEGFRHQVEQWPINPVTIFVEQLTQLHQSKVKSDSSTKKRKKIIVADFGCGEAELARQLLLIRDKNTGTCPFVVNSFDLVAKGPNAELITACDAAHTPLTAGTVDYGIFCLALMGTNLADFIREGHRVLKPDGRLFIAEVRSRFESVASSHNETLKNDKTKKGNMNNEASLQEFIHVLDQLGFEAYHTDRTNTMFVLFHLKKNGKKPRKDLQYTAKPCIYKRR